jgi:hypothetical protein
MNEEYLQYIWKTYCARKNLVTVRGEKVTVMEVGDHNHDAGPDFINAMIRINDTTWAGSVEVHNKSSDWKRHGHNQDKAYDNVILHAVYEHDEAVFRPSGEEIPVFEMKDIIPDKAFKAYLYYLNNHLWIPCANEIREVPGGTIQEHLLQLGIKRIERKSLQIRQLLSKNKGDWNQAFFISLAGTLGTRINKEPFEMLARSTPIQVIFKSNTYINTLEALFFGQAGFLSNEFEEKYPNLLAREYGHLQKKYALRSMPSHLWKFLRLRPVNFPTVRIAQMAAIYHRCPLTLGVLIDERDPQRWREKFNVNVSEYWKTHYHFDRISNESDKRIGHDTIDLIIINTIVPFLFAFGKIHDNEPLAEKSLEVLNDTPPEKNATIRTFDSFGMEFQNAAHTQGALELKKHWCDQKRCLDCKIGHELLKKAL